MTSGSLLAAINAFEMPVEPALESAIVAAVADRARQDGISETDYAILLERGLEQWASTDVANPTVVQFVSTALAVPGAAVRHLDGSVYLQLFRRLRKGTKDWTGLSHSVTRRLLSRSSLIAHLLSSERFSCSQVARLLRSTETSLDVSYPAIALLARNLELLPTLDAINAGPALWQHDQARALELMPDSTIAESCEVASLEILTWLPEQAVMGHLESLVGVDSGGSVFWPYLQMLHWCLVPVEFYDHPPSYLYEFSPRGRLALELFDRYPAVTANPVLNNAKAVESLSPSWARNRGGLGASALAELLVLLDSLPINSRRQVARVLRAWLSRVIEILTSEPLLLPLNPSAGEIEFVVAHVSSQETYTQGVIEQRIVDWLGTLAFSKPGWRAKGIGDGVNASNLSKQKLGDIEFASLDLRSAIAIEAHGGYLSAIYVKDHQRSLRRLIQQRLNDSWRDLDAPEAWSVRVLFVSHSRETSGLPSTETIQGVHVEYEYWDYYELRAAAFELSTEAERLTLFEDLVIRPLNRRTVRQLARDTVASIMGIDVLPPGEG